MKPLFTSIICLSVLSFTSCKKLEEALKTDISASPKEIEFQIPVLAQTASEISFKEIEATVNIDSLIKSSTPSFGQKNIKSIRLNSFTVDLLNADDANNFANLQSINSKLEAAGKTPLEIVSITNNPDIKSTSLSIPLAADGLELKDYISGGSFKYILKGKVRKATTKVLRAKATVKYTFTVGI